MRKEACLYAGLVLGYTILFTLLLSIVSAQDAEQFDRAQMDAFAKQWNETAKHWNAAASEITSNRFPYGELKKFDHELAKLRRSDLWPEGDKK